MLRVLSSLSVLQMKKKDHVRAAREIEQQFRANFVGNLSDVRWIVLVRHGQTDLNRAHRIAGMLEGEYGAELTKRSKRMAIDCALEMLLVERVIGGFSNALISPLSRAVETASSMLSQLKAEPQLSYLDGLKERGMGGLVLSPKSLHPQYFEDPELTPPLNGPISDMNPESFRTFMDRVRNCYEEAVIPSLRSGNTVLVSHQYTSAAIQACLFDWGLVDTLTVGAAIPNCAPLVIGLSKETLKPVTSGLCILRSVGLS
jgi:broad specificity phosphatase PhoE